MDFLCNGGLLSIFCLDKLIKEGGGGVATLIHGKYTEEKFQTKGFYFILFLLL